MSTVQEAKVTPEPARTPEEQLAEVGSILTDWVMSGTHTQEWHFYVGQLFDAIRETKGGR
jgi:hypothetical protein